MNLLTCYFICILVLFAIQGNAFTFYSPEGFALARTILQQYLPFDPHDDQLHGVCKLLDGVDLIAITPTGSGKTGYLFMFILIVKAILDDPALCPHAKFPEDPAIVIVCPTNYLEQQLEDIMNKLGIPALAINAITVAAARARGEHLWIKARESISVLILGPEQLISKGFSGLLNYKPFYERVCALGVDEIHLLVAWGRAFRKAFRQIGFMRERFPPKIPLVGLTATLRAEGDMADSVFDLLGVVRGEFHLLRRSNARYDVQHLVREMHSGMDGYRFPELDWVIGSPDKIIIFCATINLGFRVKTYLNSVAPHHPDRDIRFSLYNSLNDPAVNLKCRNNMANIPSPECQILIGTTAVAVGADIPGIHTIIMLGDPETVDMYLQMGGRVDRDGRVEFPRMILYIPAARMVKASEIVEQTDKEIAADAKRSGKQGVKTSMERSMAEFLLAPCKPAELDRQYDNPSDDPLCKCRTCISRPRPVRPIVCNCSGCVPETGLYTPPPGRTQQSADSTIAVEERLTKPMRELGQSRLEELRFELWAKASCLASFVPITEYLPDFVIKHILIRFAALETLEDVAFIVNGMLVLEEYAQQLFEVIEELRDNFVVMRREKSLEDKARAAAARVANAAKKKAQKAADKAESEAAEAAEKAAAAVVIVAGEGTPQVGLERLFITLPARARRAV